MQQTALDVRCLAGPGTAAGLHSKGWRELGAEPWRPGGPGPSWREREPAGRALREGAVPRTVPGGSWR